MSSHTYVRAFRSLTARGLSPQLFCLAAGGTLLGLAACAAEETPPPAPPPPPQYQAQVIYAAPAPPPAPTAVSYNAAMFPVAAAPIGQVGSTGGESWPSLPYSEFLAGGDDEGKRQAAWVLYHQAEREARTFAPGRWIPVVRVEYSTPDRGPADWTQRGIIHMQAQYGGATLFHELFHPAFHNSEFHQGPNRDGHWAEAWCNAFRYYAEKEFIPGPETPWAAKFDRIAGQTEAEGLGNGDHRMRVYVYPAALIIKRAGGQNGSMTTLRNLWFQLVAMRNQSGGPVLDQFFGYSPP